MNAIISAPNPVLSAVAKPFLFKKDDKSLLALLKEMEVALLSARDPKGVGLAAPQIGKSLAIFIAKPKEKSKIQVFINPEIVEENETLDETKPLKKGKRPVKLEGCLSLPDIWGEVKRAPAVTVSFQDQKGKLLTKTFDGFMATIVQHEIDHLQGVLFPKRVLEQKGKLYKSKKNEKGEDEFEELSI